MATTATAREYSQASMDVAGSLSHFSEKLAFTTGPVELQRAIDNGEVNVIDVRAAEAYEEGHVPGSLSLPRDRWDSLEGLTKDKLNVLLCYSEVCHLAATAAVQFATAGFPIMELDGGMRAWREYKMPIQA